MGRIAPSLQHYLHAQVGGKEKMLPRPKWTGKRMIPVAKPGVLLYSTRKWVERISEKVGDAAQASKGSSPSSTHSMIIRFQNWICWGLGLKKRMRRKSQMTPNIKRTYIFHLEKTRFRFVCVLSWWHVLCKMTTEYKNNDSYVFPFLPLSFTRLCSHGVHNNKPNPHCNPSST